MPPTNYKADWDDYRREVGASQAQSDFESNQYILSSNHDNTINHVYQNRSSFNHSNISLLPIRYGSDGYDIQQDPNHALTCIYGPSDSYKSFLAIDWACRVATGTNWAEKRGLKVLSFMWWVKVV